MSKGLEEQVEAAKDEAERLVHYLYRRDPLEARKTVEEMTNEEQSAVFAFHPDKARLIWGTPVKIRALATARKEPGGYHSIVQWYKDGKLHSDFNAGSSKASRYATVFADKEEAIELARKVLMDDIIGRYIPSAPRRNPFSLSYDLYPVPKKKD